MAATRRLLAAASLRVACDTKLHGETARIRVQAPSPPPGWGIPPFSPTRGGRLPSAAGCELARLRPFTQQPTHLARASVGTATRAACPPWKRRRRCPPSCASQPAMPGKWPAHTYTTHTHTICVTLRSSFTQCCTPPSFTYRPAVEQEHVPHLAHVLSTERVEVGKQGQEPGG